ncbi:MAG: hypothetical protein K0S09_183 [Sphingobacteriaceae bacterium]|jgi:hypothetical protein|nr:hypothetical protein [Sphingobacteriaceae bacterium]
MKKVLMVIALLTGVVSFSKAQGGGAQGGGRMGGTPEERLQRSMAQLEPLKLTDDQKAKVTALYVAQGKSADSLMKANQGGDRQAMMSKFMEMRAANDKKLMDLLNDNQKKQYTAMMEARRNRQGGQGGGQRPQGGGGNN